LAKKRLQLLQNSYGSEAIGLDFLDFSAALGFFEGRGAARAAEGARSDPADNAQEVGTGSERGCTLMLAAAHK
jgi:hypothetical protein